MKRRSFATFGLALVAASAIAQDAVQPPRGPAPTLQIVVGVDKANAQLNYFRVHIEKQPTRVEKTILQNGVPTTVVETRFTNVTRIATHTLALKDVTIYDTAGKKVRVAAALDKLTPGSVILGSTDGQSVDAAYLRAIRPETLILVGPPAQPVVEVQP